MPPVPAVGVQGERQPFRQLDEALVNRVLARFHRVQLGGPTAAGEFFDARDVVVGDPMLDPKPGVAPLLNEVAQRADDQGQLLPMPRHGAQLRPRLEHQQHAVFGSERKGAQRGVEIPRQHHGDASGGLCSTAYFDGMGWHGEVRCR